ARPRDGVNRYVRAYFDPLVALLYPIPKIALLPLIMFIFGLAEASKYVTVAIGVFFVMVINAESGVRQIGRIYLDVARAYRLTPRTFYLRVLLPGALPSIMAGARVAIGLAVVLAVAAEFVAARSGLGFTIFNSNQLFDVQTLYVAIVAVSLLGYALTALAGRLESVLVPWQKR
ncbi:MAG: ABC transporter permease, partial [Candidatus Eremiobacteraeota bacterium]|nr:ABC transporter permease [Candidatus Eremiobacteraeota bacterium]